MKKIKFIPLLLLLMLIFAGCAYRVPNPMTYPDYTFSQTPDNMDLRMTAVKATRDLLSVQWHTKQTISYRKTGPVSGKHFNHAPKTTYAGVLYSNANTGLFQFLEYYDDKTGELLFSGSSDALKTTIGTSCADAILWGWSTVCNSISGGFYPTFMIYPNGYLPVGDYTYDFKIDTYLKMPTSAIIEENEQSIIFESYAKVLPADALVSSTDNHAMMVIESPTIVRSAGGTIDTENSYVMIQDQRGGYGKGFYEVVEDGHTLHYSGCVSLKFTFEELYKKNFIPVTTAEFIGTKKYEHATVSISDPDIQGLDNLLNTTIASNYPLAIINITYIDDDGKETLLDKILFNGTAITGVPRTYSLNQSKKLTDFCSSEQSPTVRKIKVEVVVSTGERFVPIEFSL